MGGRNRIYLSLGWTGLDGEQTVGKNGLPGAEYGALFAGFLWVAAECCLPSIGFGNIMSRSG